MKRAMMLTVVVGLMVALAATVAFAANVQCPNRGGNTCVGTAGNDKITGTNRADNMDGRNGNDRLYGKAGSDVIKGSLGDDLLQSSTGDDRLFGGLSRDLAVSASGEDFIKVNGDNAVDRVFCGGGFDEAEVDLNDLIGGESVQDILSTTTGVDQVALSCEVLIVNKFRIPLGAIVALPRPLEIQVSLLLEEFLRDGELSPGEIEDLEEVFDLIDDGLLEDLGDLLDELLDLL